MLNKLKKIPKILREEGLYGIWWRVGILVFGDPYHKEFQKSYQAWYKKHAPTDELLNRQSISQTKFPIRPLISILTPTYNTTPQLLHECVASVQKQTYDNWELIIVDDASTSKKTLEVLKSLESDLKIHIHYRKKNGHISAASNDALDLAKGEWIALLDHDDYLWPNALFEVVKKINDHPESEFIYSDEDKITEDSSKHVDPFFKPDWSPHFLWSCNYITHFATLKTELAKKVGGFKLGTEGAQDWDLFLRATDELEHIESSHPWKVKAAIQHIDTILYSWRISATSTASRKHSLTAKTYAYTAQERVLRDYFSKKGGAEIKPSQFTGIYDVTPILTSHPLVSIIIPAKDQLPLLKKLLSSIELSTYKNIEVVIVDTGSKKESIDYYSDFNPSKYQVIQWNEPFNFSAVCNLGAENAKGDVFVFMNNDTEVIDRDWIEQLLPFALLNNVGAIAPQLLYPNHRIQNSGLVFTKQIHNEQHTIGDFVAPYFRNTDPRQNKGISTVQLAATRDYSALTGAVLMIEKKKHDQIGGWNEDLPSAFNDIDYCLMLNTSHLYCVLNPNVQLGHSESVSIGVPSDARYNQLIKDEEAIMTKWGQKLYSDSFFSNSVYLRDAMPLVRSKS